jgi:hypothetical protein
MSANFVVTPTDSDMYTVLGNAIMLWLGLDAAHVVQEFNNEVAMPVGPFVGMRFITRKRLDTDLTTWDTTNPAPSQQSIEQSVQVTCQIDCYAPNSGDWASILTTLFRSSIGVRALVPTCAPLYCDDGRRAPLEDSEEQYEDRWIVMLYLQYNPTLSTPQDFADTLTIDLINVDVRFPPT